MGSPTDGLSKARMCDKEMSAMTYNLKEQRVLEKSLQTLKLEQGYALKLLQLDNRIIKVQYKKLKDKVSRIKSHLPAEDISKFRELDAKGKLKPTHGGVNIGSAVKIAAAARRLNLGGGGTLPPSGRRGAKSALPRISIQEETIDTPRRKSTLTNGKPPLDVKLKRSSSVTGVFIDAPEPATNKRPGSASVVLGSSNGPLHERIRTVREDSDLLPVSETNDIHNGTDEFESSDHKDQLGVESAEIPNGHQSQALPTRPPCGRRAATAHPRSHSTFSSHVTAEKDARVSQSAMPSARHERSRRLSCISNDSIDSNLGENILEERRQEMLEEENVRAQILDQRTKSFIKEVELYLEQNPPLQPSHVAFETTAMIPRKDSLTRPLTADSGGGINGGRRQMRFHRRPGELDNTPTFFPEDQYRAKLLTLWKDMNKCRYLRVPDEKIDLSGVNTLVKDQMKLFEALRTGENVSVSGAWEN